MTKNPIELVTSRRALVWLWFAVMALMLFNAVASLVWQTYSPEVRARLLGPPYVSRLISVMVQEDGQVLVRYAATRNRECPTVVERWLLNSEGERMYLWPASESTVTIGPEVEYVVRFPIPSWVPPGRYELNRESIHACDERTWRVVDTPILFDYAGSAETRETLPSPTP